MATTSRHLTTEEKALKINLQPDIYGCFAEIGAGQEVAANFFKAGGSSGTIAFSHSAYDMKVSDSMYGKTKRYVCEERLQIMLDTEFSNLKNTLLVDTSTTNDKYAFFIKKLSLLTVRHLALRPP